MGSERVDKSWSKQGLGAFSTEAILGTLRHYGADASEAQFKEAAKESYPLMIAMAWHNAWKGVGQFARFPHAAALELWKRLEPGRLLPHEAAEALGEVLEEAYKKLENKPSDVKGAVAKFDAVKGKIPFKGKEPHPGFVDEMMMALGEEGMKAFDQAGPLLVKAGATEDAEAVADVEEFLVPERKGIARALLQAGKGDKEGAQKLLEGAVADVEGGEERRLRALDALVRIDAHEKAYELGLPLLDLAEKEADYHFAFDVGRLLMEALEKSHDTRRMEQLDERLSAIAAEHDKHHHH